MQHWMDLDQVQGQGNRSESKPGIENVAPCTPMQSIHRQNPHGHGTPETSDRLPSLFLGTGSSESQKEVVIDAPNLSAQDRIVKVIPSFRSFCLQQLPERAIPLATSTSSKNFQRIKIEVQREGPELHKENLLSLSLTKQERNLPVSRSSESKLIGGQCLGQPPPQRVLSDFGISKQPVTKFVTSHEPKVLTRQNGSLSSGSTLQPCTGSLQSVKPSSARAKTGSNVSEKPCHLAMSSIISTSIFVEQAARCISQESPEMMDKSASVDTWRSYQGILRSWTASSTCAALCSGAEQDLSLADGKHKEHVTYRHFLPVAPDHFGQEQQTISVSDNVVSMYGSGKSEKRSNFLSPENDVASWDNQENSKPDVFLADCPEDSKQLRNLGRKKRQCLEQLGPSVCAIEATGECAKLLWEPQTSGDCLPKLSEQQELCTADYGCKNSGVSTWRETKGKHGEVLNTTPGGVSSQLSPFYTNGEQSCSVLVAAPSIARLDDASLNNSGRVSSDLEWKLNGQSFGLKLFATPAYAQMPKGVSVFSAGEPSLPLSLELSGNFTSVRTGKTPLNLGSTTESDWGKFLALSATPNGNQAETAVDNALPFQQRFRQLQSFLKQCDESDQKERLQALRSLSAAARSCHAVELETRAIRLSLEEGKEMKRMKLLNVLGKIPGGNLEDAGATPQGPRLPAPGTASKYRAPEKPISS